MCIYCNLFLCQLRPNHVGHMRILEGSMLLRNQNKIYTCHNQHPTAFDFIRPNKELNPEAEIQSYEFEFRCVRTGGSRGEGRWMDPVVLHCHSATASSPI